MRAPALTLIQMPLFFLVHFYYAILLVVVFQYQLLHLRCCFTDRNFQYDLFLIICGVILCFISIYFGFFGHPEVYYTYITWLSVFISAVVSYYARRRIFDMKVCVCHATIVYLGFLVWAHHIVYWLVWTLIHVRNFTAATINNCRYLLVLKFLVVSYSLGWFCLH